MLPKLQKILIACWKGCCDLLEYNHLTNACSLAYTTLLSIIPILSVFLYMGSLSKYFTSLNELARNYAAENLLPATNNKVIGYLDLLSHQATRAPTVSFLFLLVTAIFLVMAIDSTMSMAWENHGRRRKFAYVFFYFIGVFAIPLIIALGSFLSTAIDIMLDTVPTMDYLKFLIPLIVNSLMLSLLYFITAGRRIRYKWILVGSVVASTLLELSKVIFSVYITHFSLYQTIYGALSVIPVFLIWVFIFWTIIIYGALVAKRCNEV